VRRDAWLNCDGLLSSGAGPERSVAAFAGSRGSLRLLRKMVWMKHLRIAIVSLAAALACASLILAQATDGKRWWSYVEALANDQMRGRLTGSPEHRKAAEYVAQQFQKAGLKAAGESGFLQPVKFQAWKIVEPESSLELIRNGAPERLTLGDDAIIGRGAVPVPAIEAPLVFAGYGLTVPETKFDDFAGLDVRGKIIVIFGGGPSDIPGALKSHYQYTLERARFLKQAGVAGVVTIQNPHTADIPWSRSSLARFQEAMNLADPALNDSAGLKIAVTVNPDRADRWLAGSGHTFAELLALVDAGKPLPHFALVPSLRAKTKIEQRDVESQNVIASLPGSDPALKSEYVVLSAHLDHLGVGEPINGDAIYNGALDNAAGVATLLEIANSIQEQKLRMKRSLLFVVVTGEEKGLLGSRYFAAHPTVPVKSMVADFNNDMFLPLHPLHLLTVYGLDESDLGDAVRRAALALDVQVQADPQPARNVFIRSDQYNFIRAGVPAVALKFGFLPGSKEEALQKAWLEERYHAPSDDLHQPVDLEGAARYNRLMLALARAVADAPARPQWKAESFFRRFAQ
jgi:Zn-dependent M28 family amino/carboxypeptidase